MKRRRSCEGTVYEWLLCSNEKLDHGPWCSAGSLCAVGQHEMASMMIRGSILHRSNEISVRGCYVVGGGELSTPGSCQ